MHTDRLVPAGPVPPRLGRLLDLTRVLLLLLTIDGVQAARIL
ncbi:hypothetical protein [Streptomyces sp. NPDC057939]